MMSLLVFLVIFFGLFGVISAQFIGQYREAYYYWVKEYVYKNEAYDIDEKRKVCSKIESFSREFCKINDILFVIIFMINFAISVIFIEIILEFRYLNIGFRTYPQFFEVLSADDQLHAFKLIGIFIFCTLIFFAIPILNHYLRSTELNSIDRKLFSLWWDCKCPRMKRTNDNKQPHRLYELLDENIKLRKINDCTQEEIQLVNGLSNKKDVNGNP